jgi:site-specific recombinase XerC
MRRRFEARELMYHVDPGRMRCGRPLGLRDGAILALVAEGLTIGEIAALKATSVRLAGGRVVIDVPERDGTRAVTFRVDLGARVIAWLNDRHLWDTDAPVFTSYRGPMTSRSVTAVLARHRRRKRARR